MSENIMTKKFTDWAKVPLILDTQDLSDLLGVHINTVKVWLREGKIKSFKIGKARRVHKADLLNYVGLGDKEKTDDKPEDL